MYDRSQSGADYTFRLKPTVVTQLRDETVNQALQTIERRVNELGVAEPVVARHSAADQILVQLPGRVGRQPRQGDHPLDGAARTEAGRAGPVRRRSLGAAGLRQQRAARPPAPARATSRGRPAPRRPPSTTSCAAWPAVTGRDLRNARPSLDENNRPAVSFSLNNEGAHQVGQLHRRRTSTASSAIVLDGRVYSAPMIESRIDAEGPHHRQLHAAGSRRPRRWCCARARCRPRSPISRNARWARRSAPSRCAPASTASVGGLVLRAALHAGLLQAGRLQRASSRSRSTSSCCSA